MTGTYTVTVGDANGCTSVATYTVTGPATGLSITETHVHPTCAGNNGSVDITVTGGTPPYTYIWNNGATTQDLTNVGAGSHTVTVTDSTGCTISICVVLTPANPIQLSMSTSATSCSGGNNGSASVAASGGTTPYTYNWNTGATTSAVSNLAAGTYTVTVTDGAGCTASISKAVLGPVPITVTLDSTVNATNGANGAAYISVSGGTAPYVYAWNTLPVKTTQDVTGLSAGTYIVTVIDATGCISQLSVIITSGVFACNTFHTETAVSWKTTPSGTNIGAYLTNHFPLAFPASLVVGGGCVGSKTLTLTSAGAVRNFLNNQPLTGGAIKLTINLTNATGTSFPSAFGANLVALKMNVVFDAYDAAFAPTSTVTLGSMIYQNGGSTCTGMTVTQVLNEANKLFGGCTISVDTADLMDAVKLINASWLGSPAIPFNTVLTCPVPKAGSTAMTGNNEVMVYPNPTQGQLNIRFVTEQAGEVTVRMMDAVGRLVWNTVAAAQEGQNDMAMDVSHIATGVYLVQVNVNGMNQTIRVVVK